MKKDRFDVCLAHSLRRADRVVSQLYSDHLAKVGLKSTQFTVLRALYYMKKGTAKELRAAIVADQTTISRVLQPLIRDGYIEVSAGASGREKNLVLSPEGKTLYKKAERHWQSAQRKLKKHLGKSDSDMLIAFSRKIVSMR